MTALPRLSYPPLSRSSYRVDSYNYCIFFVDDLTSFFFGFYVKKFFIFHQEIFFINFWFFLRFFSGPVTVPMVSTNSSPPIPMPVQVPPGHLVQQIVDESGALRHVILSPSPHPMVPLPPHYVSYFHFSLKYFGFFIVQKKWKKSFFEWQKMT